MTFTIPNKATAAYPAQAQLDSVDLAILMAGMNGEGVEYGLEASAGGGMTVDVSQGFAWINGVQWSVDADTVTIGTAHATNPRFDLVVVDDSAVVSVEAGTAAAQPVFPAVPADSIALAAVYVPALATSITASEIVGKGVALRVVTTYTTPLHFAAKAGADIDDVVRAQVDSFDFFMDATETGHHVVIPRGVYLWDDNNNLHSSISGHPILEDIVDTDLHEVGLILRHPYQAFIGEGMLAGNGASGGITPAPFGTRYELHRHNDVQIVTDREMYMIVKDDLTPGGAADRRNGMMGGFHLKDVSDDQDQVKCGILVLEAWRFKIANVGATRFLRPADSATGIVDLDDGYPTGTPALPVMSEMPGTVIITETNLPGQETNQYVWIDGIETEDVYNGIVSLHDSPDMLVTNAYLYGAQTEDINDGTMLLTSSVAFTMKDSYIQHTGRGIHVFGDVGGQGRVCKFRDIAIENPIGSWSPSSLRIDTFMVLIQGGNIRDVLLDGIDMANRDEVDIPLWIRDDVPVGTVKIVNFMLAGDDATTSTRNGSAMTVLDEGTTGNQSCVGFFRRKSHTEPERHYLVDESGNSRRLEVSGAGVATYPQTTATAS